MGSDADVKVRRVKMGLAAPNPYSPIDMIFDVGREWVTFWKTIW